MELLAKVISASLQGQLKEGQMYTIHSRFPHGINIEADGRLVFIGNKEDEILPFGILIPAGQLEALHWLLEAESALWKNGSFVTDRGCLKTKQAKIFPNVLPKLLPPKSPVLVPEFPETDGLLTGFGESIAEAKNLSGEKKTKLAKAVLDGKNLEEQLAKWIGAGPGLTPSGDDYVTGILAADRMYSFVCPDFRGTLEKLLRLGYTTDIGANQLLCAAEAEFSGSWIGFIQAYCKSEKQEMKRHLTGILKYGHTSGRDMFAGFLMGLEMARCGVEYGK